ncbi:MAG: nickel pincer cofactor biosynthesis protein LarB [Candidatus Metalachnospira sp.]|nr:nickel pincer cofactor biosynthesis protein LarB [Candidatus Metalachnospira sp.]
MNTKEILTKLQNKEISVDAAEKMLKLAPTKDLGYAVVDHQREMRNGCPEVIYALGKTKEQILGIINNMLENGTKNVLATRVDNEKYEYIVKEIPDIKYNKEAKTLIVEREPVAKTGGIILVATGGTSDIPVAEEAAVTAEFLGNTVDRLYDVGVAGIHRLLSRIDRVENADVIIAVAGMEGALATVIGGLTDKPVIAVPTSIGYGANFNGLSSLLCMLNSCASGVVVVNIDNGFGAGYTANSINKLGASR